MTGDEGTLDTETKNFVLANRSEPLVIHTESGYVIYTNHLTWTDQTERYDARSRPYRWAWVRGDGAWVVGTFGQRGI